MWQVVSIGNGDVHIWFLEICGVSPAGLWGVGKVNGFDGRRHMVSEDFAQILLLASFLVVIPLQVFKQLGDTGAAVVTGSQIMQAYLSSERTRERKVSFLHSSGLPLRFRWMKPSFWWALVTTLLMWVDYVMSWNRRTPRYFSWSRSLSISPHTWYRNGLWLFSLVTNMRHFITQSNDHFSSAARSRCSYAWSSMLLMTQ